MCHVTIACPTFDPKTHTHEWISYQNKSLYSSSSSTHAAFDKQGSEILIDNARTLNKTISDVLRAAKVASIRVVPDSEAARAGLCVWVKQKVSSKSHAAKDSSSIHA